MNMFSPFGTAPRKQYWLFSIALFFLAFIGICMMMSGADAVILAGLAVILPTVYVGTCMTIKRIRDGGCSGWFFLVYAIIGLIPYIGFVFQILWMCVPTNFWDRYKSK